MSCGKYGHSKWSKFCTQHSDHKEKVWYRVVLSGHQTLFAFAANTGEQAGGFPSFDHVNPAILTQLRKKLPAKVAMLSHLKSEELEIINVTARCLKQLMNYDELVLRDTSYASKLIASPTLQTVFWAKDGGEWTNYVPGFARPDQQKKQTN